MNRHSIAVVALVCLLAPRATHACSCRPPPSPDNALSGATAVLVGTVQAIQPVPAQSANRVTLAVAQSWKGLPPKTETVTVTTCINSACCGYEFRKGESYLVYAGGQPEALSASLCSRTGPLAQADDDIAVLNKIVAGERIAAPPKLQPAPAADVAMPVGGGNGKTVALQDGGLSLVAIDALSGKTIWMLKLQRPASGVRVEGNRVIVLPQNWVVDLATGKVISQ